MDGQSLQDGRGWQLLLVGLFFLAGYAAHAVGKRAHVPRVTLLLLLGVLAGPRVLGLVPQSVAQWFDVVAEVALSIVGFMLGERFLGKKLRESGRTVVGVSILESLGALVAVFVGLVLIGTSLPLALILASIAIASAPAATLDVVRESRSRGPLTDAVLGVVAIDDAYGIIFFSLLLAVAEALAGGNASAGMLIDAGREVFGGVALGAALGLPMAWLTGRARPGELTLIETLGFVLLCGGLAIFLQVSYLLACIALGAVVANRARHHTRPFHAIEGISQPFLILFFLMAGLKFDYSQFSAFGVAGVVYVAGRAAGKIAGGYFGARLARAPRAVQKYVGLCLFPQAGVALGLALLAAQRFPELGSGLLSLLIGTTFLFEVSGPLATRAALHLAGEAGQDEEAEKGQAEEDAEEEEESDQRADEVS